MEGTIVSNLQTVIQLADRLRDCGVGTEIPLPKIAVIGTQSSGKSSLLESIVGLDFLPRGSGVVTRTPLELRMVNVAEGSFETYASFVGSDKMYTDFKEIKEEIVRRTIAIAGDRKNIVNKPIVLNFYSKDVPTLTLVDLPGITKIPEEGQDKEIEKITTEMSLQYIKDERTIILCVIAANQDVSTSDGLKLAKDIDPKGIRTCAVLTKVDIMDKGTNALDLLENRHNIKLKHGYIAVKLRSQQDIKDEIPVAAARKKEDEFFKNDKIYQSRIDLCGTNNLSKKLSDLLYVSIRKALPEIKKELEQKIEEQSGIIQKLGEPIPTQQSEKNAYFRRKLRDLNDLVVDYLEGREELEMPKGAVKKSKGELQYVGETYIKVESYLHRLDLENALREELKLLTDQEIRKEIVTHQARSLPGFYSFEAFEKHIIKHINSLSKISEDYIARCYEHIGILIDAAVRKIFDNILHLEADMMFFTKSFTEQCQDELMKHFQYLMKSEKTYIFTCREDFIKDFLEGKQKAEDVQNSISQQQGHMVMMSAMQTHSRILQTNSASTKEPSKNLQEIFAKVVSNSEVENFRFKMTLYLEHFIKGLADTIPKYVTCSLVQEIKKEMEFYLSSKIFDDDKKFASLKEDEDNARRRQIAEGKLKLLKQARDILNQETRKIRFDNDV